MCILEQMRRSEPDKRSYKVSPFRGRPTSRQQVRKTTCHCNLARIVVSCFRDFKRLEAKFVIRDVGERRK